MQTIIPNVARGFAIRGTAIYIRRGRRVFSTAILTTRAIALPRIYLANNGRLDGLSSFSPAGNHVWPNIMHFRAIIGDIAFAAPFQQLLGGPIRTRQRRSSKWCVAMPGCRLPASAATSAVRSGALRGPDLSSRRLGEAPAAQCGVLSCDGCCSRIIPGSVRPDRALSAPRMIDRRPFGGRKVTATTWSSAI